jgi:hypothetical protein
MTVARPGTGRVSWLLRRLTTLVAAPVLFLGAVEMAVRATSHWLPIQPLFFHTTTEPPGYDLKAGARSAYWHGDRVVTVDIDDRGQRAVPHEPPTVAPVRVHVVGDSQVFGWGLSDDETIPTRLQRRLGPNFWVFNHGVPGYGPIAYARLLGRLPPGELAVVVHTEYNDFYDSYSPSIQTVARHGVLVPDSFPGRNLPGWILTSHIFTRLFELKQRVLHPKDPLPMGFHPLNLAASRVLRTRIDALYEEHRRSLGRRLLFCTIPWDARVAPNRLRNYLPRLEKPDRLVGLPDDCRLDLAFLSSPHPDALYLKDDHHLSPLGADLVAEHLATRIVAIAGGPESPTQGTGGVSAPRLMPAQVDTVGGNRRPASRGGGGGR